MGSARLVLLVLLGCGGGGESGALDGGTTRPPPGPSADGWQKSYVEGGVGVGCDAAESELADAPHVRVGDSAIYVGFEQVGQNQNPIAVRFDAGERIWCVRHESEGPDGRAVAITWDGGDVAYLVYTIVGGGSALDQAARDGWLESYAPGAISGGGPRVSFIGRVDTASGALETGTFIIAVKSDNKVNSHAPAGAVTVRADGDIEFAGSSAHKPIDADRQAMDCTDYPFESRYILSPDLGTLRCADCTNCIAEMPCE